MTTVKITLPDQLAQEARRAGLLAPDQLERWLREELRARRVTGLFAAMDRMAAVNEPEVLSPEEIAADIAAMRDTARGLQQRLKTEELKLQPLRTQLEAGLGALDRGAFTEVDDADLDATLDGLVANGAS